MSSREGVLNDIHMIHIALQLSRPSLSVLRTY